eukprot:1427303-Prymnesium_polylepis.1
MEEGREALELPNGMRRAEAVRVLSTIRMLANHVPRNPYRTQPRRTTHITDPEQAARVPLVHGCVCVRYRPYVTGGWSAARSACQCSPPLLRFTGCRYLLSSQVNDTRVWRVGVARTDCASRVASMARPAGDTRSGGRSAA